MPDPLSPRAAGRLLSPDRFTYTVGVTSTPIHNLRWWIGGLLFASTVINYIDRQTLNVLAPYLKDHYHWTNTDFATVLNAFRLAYTIMQAVSGRLLDWLGTRHGMLLAVSWYSAAMLTSLANGLWGFRFFRFLLGCGEAANWPGATKAVGGSPELDTITVGCAT